MHTTQTWIKTITATSPQELDSRVNRFLTKVRDHQEWGTTPYIAIAPIVHLNDAGEITLLVAVIEYHAEAEVEWTP